MILTFPKPYPDELLYSLCARYHIRSGNTSVKETVRELYGGDSSYLVMDLPANLEEIAHRLGPPWKSYDLLNNHTLYPYYAYFLTKERAVKMKESMLMQNGSNIHTSSGINGSKVKPKNNLWLCEECVKQDMERYGETFWRRAHQLPCVYLCSVHKTKLSETLVSVKKKNKLSFVAADPAMERKEAVLEGLNEIDLNFLFRISLLSGQLLAQTLGEPVGETIKERYVNELRRMGFASSIVNQKKFKQAFNQRFSTSFLKEINSSVEQSDWLTTILRTYKKTFHPIRHLVILLFLEIESKRSPYEVLTDPLQPVGFGPSPWECLNFICPKFHQKVITTLTMKYSKNTCKSSGEFHCLHCGCVFVRNVPSGNEDGYETIKKIDYGFIWRSRLSELVNEGKQLKYIANELGVSKHIIIRQAFEYAIKIPWKSHRIVEGKLKNSSKRKVDTLNKHKELWLSVQKNNPNLSRDKLRQLAPNTAAFIWEHDLEWANKYSPLKKGKGTYQSQVKWEERDRILLEKVKKLVSDWDVGAKKLTRITFHRIGKELGEFDMLDKHISKLPMTRKYLSEVVEDTESYQKRRIRFYTSKAHENGDNPYLWEVIEKAGIGSGCSDKIKEYIKSQLERDK